MGGGDGRYEDPIEAAVSTLDGSVTTFEVFNHAAMVSPREGLD
jgi:hypothetical protein